MTDTMNGTVTSYNNSKVIDFYRYYEAKEMDVRRYVLTPVTDFTPAPPPRARRNHHNYARTQLLSTSLSLTIIALTVLFTAQLVGMF